MSGIDLSTYQLAEGTSEAFSGKVGIDDILKVWFAIGPIVYNQLQLSKGIRISTLGTFTLDINGQPLFLISSEMQSQFKLKQKSPGLPDTITVSSLNMAQVAADSNLSRETAEKIIKKLITTLGRYIMEGRNIVLAIKTVAEITIGQGELRCNFLQDCLVNFKSAPVPSDKGKNKPTNISQKERTRPSSIQNDKQFSNKPPKPPAPKQPAPKPQRERERDPITGDRDEFVSYVPPPPRARNPLLGEGGDERPKSASSSSRSVVSVASSNVSRPMSHVSSLLNSPRSRQSDVSYREREKSALRKENLERYSVRGGSDKGHVLNARAIAAKALDVGNIAAKIRDKIIERGGSNGIKGLQRLLSIMDNNGDKKLSKEEFKYGMRDYGIDLTPNELEQVFLSFDKNGDGSIDVSEFLVGIRGEMNDRRKKCVRMAFDVLDKDGSGEVTSDDLVDRYDVNANPDVRSGKKTKQEAMKEFMKQWDRHEADGIVTFVEFLDYYKEISAGIDEDDYFELMIRNAWRIAGGEGAAANTANKRVLVTRADGSQYVETVKNELGMKAGDKADIMKRLQQQGVNAANIDLHGGSDDTKKPTKPGQVPVGRGSVQVQQQSPRPRSQEVPTKEFSKAVQISGKSQNSVPVPVSTEFSPFDVLKSCLYNPPVSLEQLTNKLQCSMASANPRIAQGAFSSRLATLDGTLNRNQLQQIWKAIDPSNTGFLDVSSLHEMLAGRYGKDKTAGKNAGIIERVIKKILERAGGSGGIKGLSKVLEIMDDSGDKKLDKQELKYGLQDYGIELNIRELDEIFAYFDRDKSGTIDVTEFLVGIRGDMNERRTKLVRMAFDILDTDGSGEVTADDLIDKYDFSADPEVKSGKKTKEEALRHFMKQWDRLESDGIVTFDEFCDYYKEISAGIDGDDYFELMIRNAWRIAGGEGAAANTANKRVLVTRADGSQYVETVKNELGMKAGDKADIMKRLQQQGVNAANIDLHGGSDDTKKPTKPGQVPLSKKPSGGTRDAFTRHVAAAKLAAAFRGRMGRKEAAQEKRKADAIALSRKEEEDEANRLKPKTIIRPKGIIIVIITNIIIIIIIMLILIIIILTR